MKNTTLIGVFVLVGFVFLAIVIGFSSAPSPTIYPNNNSNNATEFVPEQNGFQIINLAFSGYNYSPDTFNVKVGKPVRIIADLKTLTGCYQSFTIPSINVKKVFSPSNNTVEFTPTQKGTYDFSCYMGMGRGKIIAS